MAEPGAVAWQFERKGIVLVPAHVDEDELMLARARRRRRGHRRRRRRVAASLRAHRAPWPSATRSRRRASRWTSAELTMLPTSTGRASTPPRRAKQVLRLIDALDDHDDVQDVYANFDIPDDVLAAIEA